MKNLKTKEKKRIFWISDYISIFLIIFSFLIGFIVFNKMPLQMGTHWGFDGNLNGFMLKHYALFGFPIFITILYLILKFIPKTDALKENIELFQQHYNFFIVVFVIFMTYIQVLVITWNLGYSFNMNRALIPALAAFFYFIGNLMKYTKMNYCIGIRTPWVFYSEKVWENTHKFASKIFKIIAVIMIITLYAPSNTVPYLITTMIILLLSTIIYSYIEYRKNKKN